MTALELLDRPGWMDAAACIGIDRDVFFPTSSGPANTAQAKRFCADCPVVVDCLEYAIAEHIDEGVWGGASEADRHRIRNERRKARERATAAVAAS